MLMDWHALMDKVDSLCDEHFGEPVFLIPWSASESSDGYPDFSRNVVEDAAHNLAPHIGTDIAALPRTPSTKRTRPAVICARGSGEPFERCNLLLHKRQPRDLPSDLAGKPWRQWTPISSDQLVDLQGLILTLHVDAANALTEQQALDEIDVSPSLRLPGKRPGGSSQQDRARVNRQVLRAYFPERYMDIYISKYAAHSKTAARSRDIRKFAS